MCKDGNMIAILNTYQHFTGYQSNNGCTYKHIATVYKITLQENKAQFMGNNRLYITTVDKWLDTTN